MSKKGFILCLCCVVFFFGRMQITAQDLSTKNRITLIQPDYLKAGVKQKLDVDNNAVAIDTPGIYKIDIAGSAGAVVTSLSSRNDL